MRYFFVCTIGVDRHGGVSINNFDLQTNGMYPTIRNCIDVSNEKYPGLNRTVLVSISELSEEDYKQFISEQ